MCRGCYCEPPSNDTRQICTLAMQYLQPRYLCKASHLHLHPSYALTYGACLRLNAAMISLSMNEAVRRGAWTCFGCSGASRCPQALIAAKHPSSRHQRKHSSSKASNPSKDEARSLTTSGNRSNEAPSVPPVVKRPGGRRFSRTVSKPSAPKARLDVYPNIPSVPSTQHLHPMSLNTLSF